MGRLLPLLVLADFALMVVALIDCLSAEEFEIRVLPRIVWVFLILLFSPVGGIVWFFVGRPDRTVEVSQLDIWPDDGLVESPHPHRQLAPDDDPEFLRGLDARSRQEDADRLRAWEADLLRRERELQRERELRRKRERPAEEPPADPKS